MLGFPRRRLYILETMLLEKLLWRIKKWDDENGACDGSCSLFSPFFVKRKISLVAVILWGLQLWEPVIS